jgi:hypothetical protein
MDAELIGKQMNRAEMMPFADDHRLIKLAGSVNP